MSTGKPLANAGKEWSTEHDSHLRMRSDRDTVDVMAEDLGRSREEVEARCSLMAVAYRLPDGSVVQPMLSSVEDADLEDFASTL
jgi:hypothetical protein